MAQRGEVGPRPYSSMLRTGPETWSSDPKFTDLWGKRPQRKSRRLSCPFFLAGTFAVFPGS